MIATATRRRALALLSGTGVALLARPALPQGRGLVRRVANGPELAAALRAAAVAPGAVITLDPGTYGGVGRSLTVPPGTTLHAAARGRAVLRPGLELRAGSVLDGLALTGQDGIPVEYEADRPSGPAPAGDAVLSARTTYTVKGSTKISIKTANVVVRRCEFFATAGVAITIYGSARKPFIAENLFRDPAGDPSNTNANCAIQVGRGMGDTNAPIAARLYRNRMERWRTESETVSVKSSQNTLEENHLVACQNLTNRHGDYNRYLRNIIEDTQNGGITVHDCNTLLEGNRIVGGSGSRFKIMTGDCEASLGGSQTQGCHHNSVGARLRGNTGLLTIGDGFDGDTIPCRNTTVESHTGEIRLSPGYHVGTVGA